MYLYGERTKQRGFTSSMKPSRHHQRTGISKPQYAETITSRVRKPVSYTKSFRPFLLSSIDARRSSNESFVMDPIVKTQVLDF
jgi:hypothetical protein